MTTVMASAPRRERSTTAVWRLSPALATTRSRRERSGLAAPNAPRRPTTPRPSAR